MELNKLRDRAHAIALEHGFYEETHADEHYLCLIVSELMEAVEADRKGHNADWEAFMKYEERISFEENFQRHIKDSVGDELADACIRIFDYAGYQNIDLEQDVEKSPITMVYDRFTVAAFGVTMILVYEPSPENVIHALEAIFAIAEKMDIDIEQHIKLKMKYNDLRPYRNGKRY